ncbi:tetratricopeptide repeat protein [Balneola vulgaris]|uniref:tetratricopeptide repeat protein n=1 Tax=Balneola vulgaris TaxID=287535 RepID=UPI00035DD187|nr:tetratricopeptide repeat protein [Balneola vulgaris]
MTKNFTKEELEHDPLLDKYTQAVGYYNQNKTTILSVLISFVAIIGIYIGYNYYSGNQEAEAQNYLATAEKSYSEGDYATALNGDEYTLAFGFIQIADDYAGTNAGNLATYYAAVSHFKLDNYQDALAYINEYEHSKGIMGVGSKSFHATLLELNGDLEAAAKKFEEAANWDVNNSTTPFNLLKAAEVYIELGNEDKASSLLTTITEEYPQSAEATTSIKLQGSLAVN